MASSLLQRLSGAAVLFGVVGLAVASPVSARPLPGVRPARPTTAARGFSLFAGTPSLNYQVNRVQCGIVNNGTNCVDPTGSPVNENGFWPRGSPDNYVFNGGLQIAGFIPGVKTAQFPWPGDTIGAFFFDPRGDQHHGEGLTNILNAGVAADLASWPSAAMIADTGIYHPSLIGRQTVSQQDLWVRYWDGNTSLATGRQHTMGLMVDQRIMGWNYPSGNNDIIYVTVRFINITSNRLADYAGLSQYGYTAGDISDIFAVAQNYRATSQAKYNVVMPDSGFAWTNVFASYAEDPDEGDAGRNYSNGNLIFNTIFVYKTDFAEPTWQLPPSIFSAPFASAPGFHAVKYLKTPQNLGITMSGNTTNGGAFPDAVGVPRLWRNLSGNLLPTDGTCNFPGGGTPSTRHECFWAQAPSDTRMFASSGPFTINPGQAATFVVALVWAATVQSLPAATPGVFGNTPISAYNLTPYIGTANGMVPGYAIDGVRLFQNLDTVRSIDRAMGFVNYTADGNANLRVDQSEVVTVPRSLLNKELVAQAIFDNKFLLPFAPEVPQFFLVPGDNQVTVAWQASTSEVTGNPFFAVASQPLVTCPGGVGLCNNALYDANFRKFDTEGYRIWRGRTQSDMTVVASFDYAGTTITDYTGQFFDDADYGNRCAPELGAVQANGHTGAAVDAAATCPVNFMPNDSIQKYGGVLVAGPAAGPVPSFDRPLAGSVVQVPPGQRVQLANGTVFNLAADTAVTGGASGLPALTDNGVPFAYVDRGVLDGVRYFYAVTAFMVNSAKSGPSSLESPLVTKTVIPRVGSGAETPGIATLTITGRNNTVLDPTGSLPTINATTGVFSGPMPPTNGINIGFAAFLPYVASGAVSLTVDSIVPSFDCTPLGGVCTTGTYFVTTVAGVTTTKQQLSFVLEGTTGPSNPVIYQYPPIRFLNTLAGRFGGDSTYALNAQATLTYPGAWRLASKGRGAANNNPSGASRLNGPRWWAGTANEVLADPNGNVCAVLSSGGCVDTVGNAQASAGAIQGGHINGVLPGIQYLWAPMGYQTATNPVRSLEILGSSVSRAADFKVFWSAATAGKVDSVIDVTHNVAVPFSPRIRASWGILNDSSFTNTLAANTLDGNNAFLTFTDIFCVDPAPPILGVCGSVPQATSAFLMDHVISNPMNFKAASSSAAGGAALVAQGTTGNGFIFYLNGSFFVMQMSSTLAACCQNTVWNARFYSGAVTGASGSYGFKGDTRPPAVPGLKVAINFTGSTFNTAVSTDSLMQSIHTVPDPYYVTNSLEQTVNTKILRFVNLPAQAIIRIYSASGILINIISHNDPGGSGEQVWDLRNRNNAFVASGVYFYHVEAPDGRTKVGRFTVVNYAQ